MARLTTVVGIAATWLLFAAAANAAAINIGPVTHFFGNNSSPGAADGTGRSALINTPNGCMLDNGNNFYVADTVNHVVRRVAAGTQTTTSWIGLIGSPGNVVGTGSAIRVQSPTDLVLSNDGTIAYVVDFALNSIFTASINVPTTTTLYVGNAGGLPGNTDGTGTAAFLNGSWGIALKTGSNVELYITERNGHRVRKIVNAATTIFAGSTTNINGSVDANGTDARFNAPRGIAVEQSSGRLFVADSDNRKVRAISSLGVVTTLAGDGTFGNNDGIGTAARFVQPWGVVVDKSGRFLYISDKGNNVIKRLTLATNAVNTVFGTLANGWNVSTSSVVAELAAPAGVCLQFAGATQRLYVTGDHSVAYATTRHTITATVPAPPSPSTTTTTGASGPTTTGIVGTPTPTTNSTPMTTNPNSTTPSINAAPSLPTILVALTTIAALLVA